MHHASEQAFAKARAKLSVEAILTLNDRADADGFVPRQRGLRLVAADASTLRIGLGVCAAEGNKIGAKFFDLSERLRIAFLDTGNE